MFKLKINLNAKNNNNNTDRYKFHPGHRAFINSENRINKSFDKYSMRENNKTKMDRIPPLFFYRKISSPYKYSMTSVPGYLIKTNEEKHFMNKLYESLTDENDKNLFNNLINKKKINSHRDYYKPEFVDVQNILDYKPNIYLNQFNRQLKYKSIPLKDSNSNYISKNEENKKIIKLDENLKDLSLNTCPKIENNPLKLQKNELDDKSKIEKGKVNTYNEISKDNQIKYKYKLSDVFNLRQEPIFLNKSAEKYFFKETKNQNLNNSQNINNNNKRYNNNFYISSESKSDWIPNKLNNKKMGTYSSVSYNILSPMFKGSNRFINATELNKGNLYNESPEYHRVKSISEIVDLTRVSATNTLDCFNKKFYEKIPNFNFRNSVATNQLDEYRINKDLIEKPI